VSARAAAILLVAAAAAGTAPAAHAADPLAALKSSCTLRHSTDRPARRAADYRICTAPVASFDGTPLDTTVTLPARVAPGARLPLVVFLHGFLNTKKEQLSETRVGNGADRGGDVYKTFHWNNVWFASRGYAVLDYTARGHDGSGGQIQLASKDFEVRDTRRLTGVLADDPALHVDPGKVAVLGGSYGGGQAWLLLTSREDPRLQFGEWHSPQGRLVRLAAIVPSYTWTDLLYSLAPNGHQLSTGVDPAAAASPFGVGKLTLIDGFLATLGSKLTPQIAQWLARFNAGEPYDPGDPVVAEATRALTRDRSAFYQDDYFAALRSGRQRAVPVLAAQGWTDPIFPAIEPVRMYRRLRAARRDYPIELYLGDFEHLTALAKVPDLLYAHVLGNNLLDRALKGRGLRPKYDVRAAVTDCDPSRMGHIVRAPDWDALGPQRLYVELAGPQATASPLTDPRGADADPVARSTTRGRGCITTSAPVASGVAAWTAPVPYDFTLLGLPRLVLHFRSAASDLELDTRLWDLAPDGTETLITRGAYRALSPNPAGEVADQELFGNAWRLRSGHSLRLEVTQVDAGYLRPDNFASAAVIDGARLELPGREG
jgi:predicted acyl esterase